MSVVWPHHRCKSHLPWREGKSLHRIPPGPAPARERSMRRRQRVDVVIVLQTTLLLSLGRRIAELALAKRLPTI